ncbi:MAG: synaptic vesicle VAT-1 family membrane protein [Alcanivoracaceae bacterium]
MERQVWRTAKAGKLSDLQLCREVLPTLAVDKVRVRVHACGLNFADIFALTGLYSATPPGSFIPGLEFAGEVIAVGAEVSACRVGDRVMGVTRFGGYATAIDSAPGYLHALPKSWDFADGAAYLAQTLTAWYALKTLGDVQPGHSVLIHSAAGGVGLQAMRLARAVGARPVGTIGSAAKLSLLAEQGFDQVLVREKNFHRQLARSGQRFDLVLDAIGGEAQKASFAALNPMGRLVVFGAAEFTPTGNRPNYLSAAWRYLRRPRYDVMAMISDNRSVMAFNLIWLWEQQDRMHSLLAELQSWGLPRPHVGHRFDFDAAHQALDCLRSGVSTGKVVLMTAPE